MCISPSKLDNGILVPCRTCWQCLQNKVNDWVGRNLAEARTATVSYAVTFTYGRDWDGRADHIRSVLLTYHDIQKMLFRMRKAGMSVRYIVCGEYGSQLGRAHWHGVFHFRAGGYVRTKAGLLEYRRFQLPDWEGEHLAWDQEKWDRVGGIHIPEWVDFDYDAVRGVHYMGVNKPTKPMGHVHIKKATYAHVKYALKYLLKDTGDDKSQWKLAMSKKPALGYQYFTELATESVSKGLIPQDLKYSFPVRTMSGQEVRQTFMLRRTMAEIYLKTVITEWEKQHPGRPRPPSEVVDTYAQWGRLGSEENLTAAWVEELPGQNSIFETDGELRRELLEQLEAPVVRELNPVVRRSNIRSRTDWAGEYIMENTNNGTLTEQEQQFFIRDFWREAERHAQSICPLTEAQLAVLTGAERNFWVNHPTRFQSVYGWAVRARLGDATGAPRLRR